MDLQTLTNDPESIVEADRAHVWHHLIQHKPFETIDPRIIVEGKGTSMPSLVVFGQLTSAMAGSALRTPCAISW